jgi:hypothetical protein
MVGALAVAWLLLFFARPQGPVDDFWWHLATGRWIVQQGELPAEDPFAFTTSPEPDARKSVILRGYWLAQIVFYGVHQAAGFPGLIALQAILFTAIVGSLWYAIARQAGRIRGTLLAAVALPFAAQFTSLRPHAFTFLGVVVLFALLEKGMNQLRSTGHSRTLLLLAPLMLIWANFHPGFVVAFAVGGIYLLAECVTLLRGRSELTPAMFLRLVGALSLAGVASAVNPNGLMPLVLLVRGEAAGPFTTTIEEYMPLWRYQAFTGEWAYTIGVTLVSAGAAWLLFVYRRRLQLTHILLYLGFTVAGFLSYRYSLLLVLMVLAISGTYLGRSGGAYPRTTTSRVLASSGIALLVIAACVWAYRGSVVHRGLLSSDVPRGVADHFLQTGSSGRIFNPYEWGGYFIWRLHPRYQVFIDSRTLDLEAYEDYKRGLNADPLGVLDRHRIETASFYYLYKGGKPLSALVFTLLADARWELAYSDEIGVVFSRGSSAPAALDVRKRRFVSRVLDEVSVEVRAAPKNPNPRLLSGQLSYLLGDPASARKHFQQALAMDPGNDFASQWLRYLDGSG